MRSHSLFSSFRTVCVTIIENFWIITMQTRRQNNFGWFKTFKLSWRRCFWAPTSSMSRCCDELWEDEPKHFKFLRRFVELFSWGNNKNSGSLHLSSKVVLSRFKGEFWFISESFCCASLLTTLYSSPHFNSVIWQKSLQKSVQNSPNVLKTVHNDLKLGKTDSNCLKCLEKLIKKWSKIAQKLNSARWVISVLILYTVWVSLEKCQDMVNNLSLSEQVVSHFGHLLSYFKQVLHNSGQLQSILGQFLGYSGQFLLSFTAYFCHFWQFLTYCRQF